MDIEELYKKIDSGLEIKNNFDHPGLDDLNINVTNLKLIDEWAWEKSDYGALASYIPELTKANPGDHAIAIGDLNSNELEVGVTNTKVSVQSVIKPFLYLYALENGADPDDISNIEASAFSFNEDRILHPGLHLQKPDHPLNNAGAISSAGEIHDFTDFLKFMRKIARNSELDIIKDVFKSEMETNNNNRAIAYRLTDIGRFKNKKMGEDSLLTSACSLGMTPLDIMRASIIIASGGIDVMSGNRIVDMNNTVRVMSAMNTFGLYEQSGRVSLLVSGSRANTAKSGVGGLIININPGF